MNAVPSQVRQYLDWLDSRNFSIPVSLFDGVSWVGDFANLILHRHGQFQAQLTLCRPGSVIPAHSHPDVDTLVVYVSGALDFSIQGVLQEAKLGIADDWRNGFIWEVGPGVLHSAVIGSPSGAAFISAQHWIRGTPSPVQNNWVGPALGGDHKI